MVLENLALLDAKMRAAAWRAARCTVRCSGALYSAVFVNDTCPQELLVFRLDPRRWARLSLLSGYRLEPVALRPLVEPGVPADAPVAPELRRWLHEFALALPRALNEAEQATPEVILQHSLDVEEPTKVFFAGWVPLPEPQARPTHPNLLKIRRAFGQDAFELCLHLHQGCRWTDQVAQRVAFELPE